MFKITLPAPAKLNRFLHITGQRDNGMHELQTIFQFIDLADELTFTRTKTKKITLSGNLPELEPEHNLVIQAAKMLQQATDCRLGAEIHLTKRIPIGAGLGGGSSDAATTLLALNQLWQTNLTKTQLMRLGEQLGADVPVFIFGQNSWAEGIGEQLTPISLPETWIILLIPPVQISTAEVFCNEALPRNTSHCKMAVSLVNEGVNDCQNIVTQLYPEVAQAIDWLNQFAIAKMTGTGSCVFAPVSSKQQGQAILTELPKRFRGHVVKTLHHSPVNELLNVNAT
jgi:4-diphosphocytidyl-2-C-methyl-D-erythritol kinase